MSHLLRALPYYDRFISLMPRLFVPLMVLLHSLGGEEAGVYFAGSTKLAVCHNRRIHRHKVFDGVAAHGKTSMGWFYGLKLHFVINHKGQIMALKITPGNTADSAVLEEITQHLTGKLYADKGSISRAVFSKLWQRGLHRITGIGLVPQALCQSPLWRAVADHRGTLLPHGIIGESNAGFLFRSAA